MAKWCGACILALFFIADYLLYGQANFATVTGAVTDSAQAVVPGVVVVIRNTETNISHEMKSNAEGYFTLTDLPPGVYELTAAKEGFHRYREVGIALQVGQTLRNDIQLKIGAVTETVSVTAEIAPLNTENGMIKGDVIVRTEIQDIPLNGRDFTELALLVPGVTRNAQGGAGSFASINGARGDNTNFRVDGFDDRNVRGAAAQLRPNMDALQEFKMEVSGYSAEYGKMAGGILNMVLRSGGNVNHASYFEYFRNDFFDSRPYFANQKLGFHQNQWGATFTGPVKLPKVYDGHDRTFFMFSWESFRNPWGQNMLGNVPTALQHAGDFSQTVNNAGKPIVIRNPFDNNTPFPGNVIPQSQFNAVGRSLVAIYPLPNRLSPGNNYLALSNNQSAWDSALGKVDHRFSSKDGMAFRFGKRFGRSNAPWAGSNLGLFQNYVRDDRLLGGIDYTHMFTSTFVSEFRIGVSRNASREHQWIQGLDVAEQIGMKGSTKEPLFMGLPLVNVTNYLALGYAANEPIWYYVTDWQFGGKFTWIKSSHLLKFGFDYARYQFNQPYYNNSRGTMTASGVWSGAGTATNGDAIADMELGLLASSSINRQGARNYMRETGIGLFINDDYKLARRLTLNLGFRYELESPPYDKYDRVTNFVPEFGKIIVSSDKNIPGFQQSVETAGLQNLIALRDAYDMPRGLIKAFYKGFSPRAGFAWRPIGDKTVFRGGYGIFYSGQLLNDIRNGLDNTFPVVLAYSFNRVASNENALTLSEPWPTALGVFSGTTSATGYQYNAPTGYLQSYNFTVERDTGFGAVFEAAFVGSKGTHLGKQYNYNFPFRSLQFYKDVGTNFPTPFPQLGTINYWGFGTNSIYNSGQFTLRRRASGGFFYRISYSYSKSIDTGSQFTGQSTGGAVVLDPRNFRLERGRSDWDRGHIGQISFAWPVPAGRGKKYLPGAHGVVNAIVGGWTLSGTNLMQTGAPLTIQDSSVNANIGESTRPNRIATGKDPKGTGRRGVDYPWFDPPAFVHAPACVSRTNCTPDPYGFIPFTPGNSGRGILDTPGLFNINLSSLKSFRLGETKRLVFRWEVFNIINHPNFLISAAFRNYNETGAGYLPSVAGSGNGGPRIMQFALRFEY